MSRVYIGDRSITPDPTKMIGKGGEADVFNIGSGKALKLFKPPDHPDYQGQPNEQRVAEKRIQTHQEKLPAFPKGLPPRVITPQELATDKTGRMILGYTMRLLGNTELLVRYSDRGFREAGIADEMVINIFRDMLRTISAVHKAGVVIGDFNDLNILVSGEEAHFIDADSFQFGKFICQAFTIRFVDPLLVRETTEQERQNNLGLGHIVLNSPYVPDSDWYAYAVMLMQSLLFVDPYGGIYKPKDKTNRIPHSARPLQRITVFHPEVKYPKPARPYGVLPDEVLEFFYRTFEKDQRGEFPLFLLENMRWTKCTDCGTVHARNICPECAQFTPAMVKEVTQIRGEVKATRIFQTSGLILFAAYQKGKLNWLYHEDGKFKREDGSVVTSGDLNPQMRFRLSRAKTLIAQNGRVITISPDAPVDKLVVDSFGSLPVFDANEQARYWVNNGQLLRDGELGQKYIGDVLSGQTLFWVGSHFGFGFYRAGQLSVAFVFDAKRTGINDNVKLPPFKGQLVDSTCVFTEDRCWFFISMQEGGKIINRCMVIRKNGSIEATAQAEGGDGSWLGTLRGKCAAKDFLLAATDEGIVRLVSQGGQISQAAEFPDTESFVDSGCHLFPGKEGIYVVSRNEIRLIKIIAN